MIELLARKKREKSNVFIELGECEYRLLYSPNWIRPYESLWSILQSIKLVNVVSNRTLCSVLDLKCNFLTTYSPNCVMYFNKVKEIECLNELLKIPEEHYESLNELKIYNIPDKIIAKNVRICPECYYRDRYHSYYHQIKTLDVCPWHGCKLIDTEMFYGIESSGSGNCYSYGSSKEDNTFEILLPSMRNFIPLHPQLPDFGFVEKIAVINNPTNTINAGYDFSDKNTERIFLFNQNELPRLQFLKAFDLLENYCKNANLHLNDIVIKEAREVIMNFDRNKSLEYDLENFYIYCFLQNLLDKYHVRNTRISFSYFELLDKEIDNIFELILYTACCLTKTSDLWMSISAKFYTNPYSVSYREYYSMENGFDIHYISDFKNAIIDWSINNKSKEDRFIYNGYIEFKLYFMFLENIWNQLIKKMGSGIKYRELKNIISYPCYILELDKNGNYYLTEEKPLL